MLLKLNMSSLSCLTSLCYLVLDDGGWIDADVAQLALCTGLESLDLGDCCRVSEAVLKYLQEYIPVVIAHHRSLNLLLEMFLGDVQVWSTHHL